MICLKKMLDCKNFITNLADIDDKIDIIVERFKIKKILNTMKKKRVDCILKKIRYSMFDFYLSLNAIGDLHEKHHHEKIDGIVEQFSKNSNAIDEFMDQIERLRNEKKSLPEELIAARVKLRRQKVERLKRKKTEILKDENKKNK